MICFKHSAYAFVLFCFVLAGCQPPTQHNTTQHNTTQPSLLSSIPQIRFSKDRVANRKAIMEHIRSTQPFSNPIGPDSNIYQEYLKYRSGDFNVKYSWGPDSYTGEFTSRGCRMSFEDDPTVYRDYWSIPYHRRCQVRETASGDWGVIAACDSIKGYEGSGYPIYDVRLTCSKNAGGSCALFNFAASFHTCETTDDDGNSGCFAPLKNSDGTSVLDAGGSPVLTQVACDGDGDNEPTDPDNTPVLFAIRNRNPVYGMVPGDEDNQRGSVSPADQNGAYDAVDLDVIDDRNVGWFLSVDFNDQELLRVNGTGSQSSIDWNPNNLAISDNGMARIALIHAVTQRVFNYKVRVDNDPPVISDVSVMPTQNADVGIIRAKVLERNTRNYQTGINESRFQVHFDSEAQQLLAPSVSFDSETGEFSAEFSGYSAYHSGQQGSPESEFGFELIAEDYVGNTASSRPPKDNLKLSIPDNTWFSPHEDSTKKQVSFDVLDVDNTGASWTVEIRKNGQVYKTYTGSGSQTLSWDGLFEGAAVSEGKYNIVLKNAKQPGRERERDFAQVGVDMSPPEITYQLLKTSQDDPTKAKIKITAHDPQTGVKELTLNQVAQNIIPGVPIIQELETETILEKKYIAIYNIIYPTFTPTENSFKITNTPSDSIDDLLDYLDKTQVLGEVTSRSNINIQSSKPITYKGLRPLKCQSYKANGTSGKSQFELSLMYDFDPEGPDLTAIILPTQSNYQPLGPGDVMTSVIDVPGVSSGTNLKLQFPFSQQKQAKINEKRNAANALFTETKILRSQGKVANALGKENRANLLSVDAQVLINLANDEVIRFDQATNAAYLTNRGVSYNQMYNQYLSNSPTLARVMSDMSKFKLSSNLKLNNKGYAQLLFSGINLDRIRDSLQGSGSGSFENYYKKWW